MAGVKKTWLGACHCRRTRFEITADIDHARVCNCTICHHRGALIFRVEAPDFRLLTPLEDLGCYEWGTGTAKDYFCTTCGILPFRRPRQPNGEEQAKGWQLFTGWAVNLRCIEALDPGTLPVRPVNGAALPLPG